MRPGFFLPCRLLIDLQAGPEIRPAGLINKPHSLLLLFDRLGRLTPGKEKPGQEVVVIRVVRHPTDCCPEFGNDLFNAIESAIVACRARIRGRRAARRITAQSNSELLPCCLGLRTGPPLVIDDGGLLPGQHDNNDKRAESGKEDARGRAPEREPAVAAPDHQFAALLGSRPLSLLPEDKEQAVAAEYGHSAQQQDRQPEDQQIDKAVGDDAFHGLSSLLCAE